MQHNYFPVSALNTNARVSAEVLKLNTKKYLKLFADVLKNFLKSLGSLVAIPIYRLQWFPAKTFHPNVRRRRNFVL